MPRFARFRVGGGEYVLKSDRDLPPAEQVRWVHRDPLPSEVAELEDSSGYSVLGEIRIGRDSVDDDVYATAERRWVGHGATNSINLLIKLLTDVAGLGPDGKPLAYPNGKIEGEDGRERPATRVDKERFLAQFAQEDLYEVAAAIESRKALSEDESGN